MLRGLLLVALGAILVAPGWSGLMLDPWATRLGWIGTVLIILGSALQYFAAQPFERLFVQADWMVQDGKATLTLTSQQHRKGTAAQGEIYAKNAEGGYHACMAGVLHNEGKITFSSTGRGFDCKIVIR